MIMKYLYAILCLIVLISCKSNYNNMDTLFTCKEEKIVLTRLKMIKSYQSDTTIMKYKERINCVFFLEMLTKINSPTCANYAGMFEPSINDYNNWYQWYQIRKDSICNDYYKRRIDSIYKIAH